MSLAGYFLLFSALAVFYIVTGYPLLLALRQHRPARPVLKDPGFRTSVSVVIAVHNGASMIRRKMETLFALDYPRDLTEIIVVSDGSTDETEAILRAYAEYGVKTFAVPRGGKAAALNQALEAASGEILFFTDVRQPLHRDSLRHLVANFADPSVGAVTGELRLVRGEAGEQTDMDLYWRYEVWARTIHSHADSLFTATGCIYAMRRVLAEPLAPDTLSDDAVLPLRAFFKGYRVVFDREALAYDYPAVTGTEFRRRWRNLAGQWQVWMRMPQLFTSRNRMRFDFVSHKFARLVLPWTIAAFVVSSAALPSSGLRTALLVAEGSAALLALCDRIVPKKWLLKRLTSPLRTFLVMNAAAMAALAVFFVPANTLWAPTRVEKQKTPATAQPAEDSGSSQSDRKVNSRISESNIGDRFST